MDNLARRAAVVGTSDPLLLEECLIALSGTVEELRVSEEELHAQHQTLAASRELADAERRRYQELFDYAPDAYLITNPDGVIQEANRAAAVLLGVQENTLTDKPLVVFVPEEDRRGFRRQLPWLFETERLDGWEIRLVPRRKSPILVDVTVAPVRDAAGRGTGLRWLIRDISRRKREGAAQPAGCVGPAERTTSRAASRTEAGIAEWRPALFDACRPAGAFGASDAALSAILREHILRGLFVGLLKQGDRLPGVREVGRAAGLNHKVVTRAYSMLVEDGVVEVRDRSGVYVAEQNPSADKLTGETEQWLAAILAEAWRHRAGTPPLSKLIPLQSASGTLRSACVEADEATRAMLCTELQEKFGLEAYSVVLSNNTVKLASELEGADLVVTTPFYAGEIRKVTAALGKPMAIATRQPDACALSTDTVQCIARLLVRLNREAASTR